MSCSHGAPEFDPYKEASPSPGEEWVPTEKEREKSFELEELPTIPQELEPEAESLRLSQLVDIALANNPTTQIAWEDARAAAAAWAEARGLYYPQITGQGGYFYARDGGSSAGGDGRAARPSSAARRSRSAASACSRARPARPASAATRAPARP